MISKEKVCQLVRKQAEEVRRTVFSSVFKSNMQGMCAICSIALAEAFRAKGWKCRTFYGTFYKPGSTKGHNHCWLEDEQYIYDLTATQFGEIYPVVHIVPKNDPCYRNRDKEVDLDCLDWAYVPKNERPSKNLLDMFVIQENNDA